MSWNVSFGISGRACCRICEKVITKEQLQVNFSHDGGVHTVVLVVMKLILVLKNLIKLCAIIDRSLKKLQILIRGVKLCLVF